MKNKWIGCIVVMGACLTGGGASQTSSNSVITPTRVILTEAKKYGDISIINRGAKSIRYRLALADMEMSETGVLAAVAGTTSNSAKAYLKLSPREFVLEPGEVQRVKIAAALGSGVATGEYRSHLTLEPQSEDAPPEEPASDQSIIIRLKMRSVVTIPIFVRKGNLQGGVKVENAMLLRDTDGSAVRFTLVRSGNRTIRGECTLTFVPSRGGDRVVLGRIVDLPVYEPNQSRQVMIRADRELASLGDGSLEVRFAEPGEVSGACSAALTLPIRN